MPRKPYRFQETTRSGRDKAIDRKVGSLVRQRRMLLSMSQEQFGKLLKTSFQQVQKYEKGLNSIAASRIPSVCKALNLSPNELFEWDPSAKGGGNAPQLPEMDVPTMRHFLLLGSLPKGLRSKIFAITKTISDNEDSDA